MAAMTLAEREQIIRADTEEVGCEGRTVWYGFHADQDGGTTRLYRVDYDEQGVVESIQPVGQMEVYRSQVR